MSPIAAIAIHAAKHVPQWGLYAACRYAAKRNVPPRLLILAIALEHSRT